MVRAAALACLAATLLGCSDGDDAPRATTTTTELEKGSAAAVGDVVAGGGRAAHVTDTRLPAGEGTVLVVFDQLPFSADCLVALQLVAEVVAGTGELAVYPSIENDAADFVEGTPLGGVLLRSNRPRATATLDASPGTLRWDVLDHYRGDPYVRTPTSTERFALGIRPLTLIDSTDIVFSSSESGRGPELRWSKRPGCT